MKAPALVLLLFALARVAVCAEDAPTNVPLSAAPSGDYALEWTPPAGPLRVVSPNKSFAAIELSVPPLVKAWGEGTMDERMPLPFISPDSNWIFIPSRDRQNSGISNFTYFEGAAVLFHRTSQAKDGAIHFEPALAGRFDQAGWQFAGEQLKLKDPASTADAHRICSAEFTAWSQDSGRLLMIVSGGAWSPSKNEWLEPGPGSSKWYCYFNTRTGKFEMTERLRAANRPSRNDATENQATALAAVVIEAEIIGKEGPQRSPKEHFDEADKRLNEIYGKLIAKIEPAKRPSLRDEEREWIQSRDTEAQVEAIRMWSYGLAADARILESKALSTEKRVADLQKRLETR